MTLKTGVSALCIFIIILMLHIFFFFFFKKREFFLNALFNRLRHGKVPNTRCCWTAFFKFLFFSFGYRTSAVDSSGWYCTAVVDMWRTRNIREGRGGSFDRGTHAGTRPLSPQKGAGPWQQCALSLSFNVVSTFCLSFFFPYSLRSTAVQSAGCCCSLLELSRTRTLYPQTTASLEQRRQFLSLPFSSFFWLPSYFWMPTLLGVQWDHLWRNNAYCRPPFDFW